MMDSGKVIRCLKEQCETMDNIHGDMLFGAPEELELTPEAELQYCIATNLLQTAMYHLRLAILAQEKKQ